MTAPRKPCTQVHSDAQPKLTTKSGIASGTTTSTAQTRRPGRLVRSTHQAAAVPITAHRAVTTTVSRTVFHSRSAVSLRKIRCATVAAPAPRASISRKTSGSASTQATARLAAISATGRRLRRGRTAGTRASAWPGAGGGPGRCSVCDAVIAPPTSPSPLYGRSQQARLAHQRDGRGAGAEVGDRHRIGLELAQRRLGRLRGHAGCDRVLEADRLARVGDDALALVADQERQALLRRGLVRGGLQHPGAGYVHDISGIARRKVSDV